MQLWLFRALYHSKSDVNAALQRRVLLAGSSSTWLAWIDVELAENADIQRLSNRLMLEDLLITVLIALCESYR